ncbi:MAG: flavin reductase family protein [Candidatus Thermoplasmatota archaeon]|nr:flavin reductase family protein [Candidatus Thermoplasmatota archaeon]
MKKQLAPEKFIYYTFPKMAVLVTVVSKAQPNIITLAWHSPLSFNPPLYGISIDPKRYSHNLILEAKEFVVNFAPWEILDKLHYCGKKSGRETDKFEATGLTQIAASKVKAPLIKECYSHLECRLVESKLYGDHTLFIGKIVAVSVNEDCFNEILKQNTRPIYYLGANTYTTIDNKVRKKL